MFDDPAKIVVHMRRITTAPSVAVHADFHVKGGGVRDLISGDDPRSQDAASVKILALALGRAKLAGHFDHLRVPSRDVIQDRIAKNVGTRVSGRDILAARPDDDRQLQFDIQHLRVRGPDHVFLVTDKAHPVTLVIDGLIIPDRRDGKGAARHFLGHRKTVYQVGFKDQTIAILDWLKRAAKADVCSVQD